jgi:hypothetical protein
MSRVGFELTIPVFERAKTVHELYREATVIGTTAVYFSLNRTVAMFEILLIRSQGRNNEKELCSCRHLNMTTFHIYVCSCCEFFEAAQKAYEADMGTPPHQGRDRLTKGNCILTLHVRFQTSRRLNALTSRANSGIKVK